MSDVTRAVHREGAIVAVDGETSLSASRAAYFDYFYDAIAADQLRQMRGRRSLS